MKKLFIILIILISCDISENITGLCGKAYIIQEWNMLCTPEYKAEIADTTLNDCFDIRIKIYSDSGDSTYLNNYRIENNTIILEADEKFRNQDYDDNIERGKIYLLWAN